MILADTSVWIQHFRVGSPALARLLDNQAVSIHPWVTGELALGNFNNRQEVIGLLHSLPQAIVADDAEILELIEHQQLYGAGIGYVDAQLVASTMLTPDTRLWTRDKRLAAVAARLGLGYATGSAGRMSGT